MPIASTSQRLNGGQGCRALGLASIGAAMLIATDVGAADQWIEVKTANFTVVSNAGERSTRTAQSLLDRIAKAGAE
jgi:hypothetical protein